MVRIDVQVRWSARIDLMFQPLQSVRVAVQAGRWTSLDAKRPATMDVLRRSSVQCAAVTAALSRALLTGVDGFSRRHLERLRLLQGIIVNFGIADQIASILAPLLLIRRGCRLVRTRPVARR